MTRFMNNGIWLKKLGAFAIILLFAILFGLNKSRVYESETDVLFLPKNETTSRDLSQIIGNFQQVLMSLAFNDRISDGSDALTPGVDLPNYRRKEFWDAKISVTRAAESGVVRIKNFDADSTLAKELNQNTVENLIALAGNYYNIKTDLEIRIVDGPIVEGVASQDLLSTLGQSLLWALGIYVVFFFISPIIFIKKEGGKRDLSGRGFPPRVEPLKKSVPSVFPEEDNYFATKNFFENVQKAKELKTASLQKNVFSLPAFPRLGKKAPTPANLPVGEEEVPDIFRQKEIVPEIKNEDAGAKKEKEEEPLEYVPREATPEEVKARLNRLLRGGK